MNRWPSRRLIWLGALTVVVHTALLFFAIPKLSNRLAPAYNQNRFTDGYDQLAANLATGNGYRFYPDTAKTLMREPGYPIFLAGLLLLFGNSFTAVKIANVILAIVTAWLMMRIAGKLTSSQLLSFAPPLLFLFHPGTLIAESRGGIEIIFALLSTAFVLAMYRLIESNRWRDYVACGIVLGITVSVRSVLILFPLVLLVYLLLFESRQISKRTICWNVGCLVIAMLAVLSPWIIRNYSLTGKIVPTASVLGVSAHAGQYICMHLSENKPWWILDREASRERGQLALKLGYSFKETDYLREGYYQTFYRSQDEIAFSKYLFGRVVGEYARTPTLFLKCLCLNLFNFWFAGKTWMSTAANMIIQLPYLILAVIGAVLGVKNNQVRVVGPLVLLIGYVVAVHLPILAQARYSVPLIPFLSILASIPLIAAWQKRTQNTSRSTETTSKMNHRLTVMREAVSQNLPTD